MLSRMITSFFKPKTTENTSAPKNRKKDEPDKENITAINMIKDEPSIDKSKLAEKKTDNSIGLEIMKDFGEDGIFSGKVVDISSGDHEAEDEVLYRIVYEDGDSEDFDAAQLEEGRKLYQKTLKQKQRITIVKEEEEKKNAEEDNQETTGRRRRGRGRVSYAEIDEDSMELDSDEDEIRQTRKRLKKSEGPSKKQKRKDDDGEFEFDDLFDEESDSDLPDDMIVDEEEDDDDDDFVEEVKAKPWGASKKKSKPKKNNASAKKSNKSGMKVDIDGVDDEFEERLRIERGRVKANNNPQKMPSAGSYVDPVGVDPTHGIVERIVSDQVRKVGGLLQRVQAQKNIKLTNGDFQSELSYPIRLQTACSGTDAPSIALGLIKESLSRLCSKNDAKEKQKFDYEHKMSCEIEPFKQAYIARNFPGVPLFPDITKLSTINEDGKGKKVVDVYGRPQHIPEGDLFVAGTSCKDFSMLKTTRRKDIQDKGQSGETFLAAVEFLDLYQPPFAIFENVDGAPWGKMQEYIQGRINLADRNNNKAITSTKRKNGMYLRFSAALKIVTNKLTKPFF